MPNIATVLKAEVTRLARKELRTVTESLKKALAAQRSEIASIKLRLATQEKLTHQLSKAAARVATAKPSPVAVDAGANRSTGFQASVLASERKRLKLSAADYGLLLTTTGQTIYSWERGDSHPRAKALKAIAALHGITEQKANSQLARLRRSR